MGGVLPTLQVMRCERISDVACRVLKLSDRFCCSGLFVLAVIGACATDEDDDGPDNDDESNDRPKTPANRVETYMSRSDN